MQELLLKRPDFLIFFNRFFPPHKSQLLGPSHVQLCPGFGRPQVVWKHPRMLGVCVKMVLIVFWGRWMGRGRMGAAERALAQPWARRSIVCLSYPSLCASLCPTLHPFIPPQSPHSFHHFITPSPQPSSLPPSLRLPPSLPSFPSLPPSPTLPSS